MSSEELEVLRTINNNIARLTMVNHALADELHMIRRALEGDKGSFSDPVVNEYECFGIEEDIEPEFL